MKRHPSWPKWIASILIGLVAVLAAFGGLAAASPPAQAPAPTPMPTAGVTPVGPPARRARFLSTVGEACRAKGTSFTAWDDTVGLRSVAYACGGPAVSYDLAWTRPGVVYADTINVAPPDGATCVLTLTNKADLYITGTLTNPGRRNCGDGGSAGGDRPGDDQSAAGSAVVTGDTFAVPEGARLVPRVAILQRGLAHDLWQVALQVGEPAAYVGADFDPVATAGQYTVLLIPSGGLYGLESSPSFK